MSMQRITLLQFLAAFGAYFLITVALPAAVFGNRIKGRRLVERILFYFVVGNFYIMNLVFTLQLLKISYPITLIAGTVIPALLIWGRLRHISISKEFVGLLNQGKWILEGSMGLRTALYRFVSFFGNIVKKAVSLVLSLLKGRLSDWLLTAGVIAAIAYIYGTHMLTRFGYIMSDMPVHNYWINSLNHNNIFVAGVYPYGFHSILYYLHAVFNIDTYVLMRVFALVQNIWIHVMLLFFLKCCCKNRYTPYIGVFFYIIAGCFTSNIYYRYLATLPQEFGMLFILPSIHFLILFFQTRKEELVGSAATCEGKEREGKIRKEKVRKEKVRKAKKHPAKIEEDLIIEDLSLEDDMPDDAGPKEEWSDDIIPEEESWDDFTLKVDPSDDYDFQLDFDLSSGTQLIKRKERVEEIEEVEAIEEVDEIDEIDEIDDIEEIDESASWDVDEIETLQIIGIVSEDLFLEDASPVRRFKKLTLNKGTFLSGIYGRLAERVREGRRSDQYLAGFIMSFAMTLSVHFYGTMIAGLFCIGIAVGYFFRLFRKKYFGTVMLAGILSIVVAVLPMFIAFITGTPMEGSLRWAMSVISNGSTQEAPPSPAAGDDDILPETGSGDFEGDEFTGNVFEGANSGTSMEGDFGEGAFPGNDTETSAPAEWIKSFKERIQGALQAVTASIDTWVMTDSKLPYGALTLGTIMLVAVAGVWMWIIRQPDYGAILISVAAYMGLMSLLQAAVPLGLPVLMDEARCSIYFAYSVVMLLSLLADAILYALLGWMRRGWLRNGISFLTVLAVLILFLQSEDLMRPPYLKETMETNGAIISLTSIRMEERDFTWTIISANDETRMIEDNGYHYEIIQLLWDIENGKNLTIPTPSVYFFIEKVPVDYFVEYAGSGQSISKVGASYYLPSSISLSAYQGMNRWVVMSRLYYWAQAFQKMYPHEMKVYLETDDFICYKLTQNPNALFNLSIDYGYNTMTAER